MKGLFQKVLAEIEAVLGIKAKEATLQVVGDGLFMLLIPAGVLPNRPEIRIDDASAHEVVPKLLEAPRA